MDVDVYRCPFCNAECDSERALQVHTNECVDTNFTQNSPPRNEGNDRMPYPLRNRFRDISNNDDDMDSPSHRFNGMRHGSNHRAHKPRRDSSIEAPKLLCPLCKRTFDNLYECEAHIEDCNGPDSPNSNHSHVSNSPNNSNNVSNANNSNNSSNARNDGRHRRHGSNSRQKASKPSRPVKNGSNLNSDNFRADAAQPRHAANAPHGPRDSANSRDSRGSGHKPLRRPRPSSGQGSGLKRQREPMPARSDNNSNNNHNNSNSNNNNNKHNSSNSKNRNGRNSRPNSGNGRNADGSGRKDDSHPLGKDADAEVDELQEPAAKRQKLSSEGAMVLSEENVIAHNNRQNRKQIDEPNGLSEMNELNQKNEKNEKSKEKDDISDTSTVYDDASMQLHAGSRKRSKSKGKNKNKSRGKSKQKQKSKKHKKHKNSKKDNMDSKSNSSNNSNNNDNNNDNSSNSSKNNNNNINNSNNKNEIAIEPAASDMANRPLSRPKPSQNKKNQPKVAKVENSENMDLHNVADMSAVAPAGSNELGDLKVSIAPYESNPDLGDAASQHQPLRRPPRRGANKSNKSNKSSKANKANKPQHEVNEVKSGDTKSPLVWKKLPQKWQNEQKNEMRSESSKSNSNKLGQMRGRSNNSKKSKNSKNNSNHSRRSGSRHRVQLSLHDFGVPLHSASRRSKTPKKSEKNGKAPLSRPRPKQSKPVPPLPNQAVLKRKHENEANAVYAANAANAANVSSNASDLVTIDSNEKKKDLEANSNNISEMDNFQEARDARDGGVLDIAGNVRRDAEKAGGDEETDSEATISEEDIDIIPPSTNATNAVVKDASGANKSVAPVGPVGPVGLVGLVGPNGKGAESAQSALSLLSSPESEAAECDAKMNDMVEDSNDLNDLNDIGGIGVAAHVKGVVVPETAETAETGATGVQMNFVENVENVANVVVSETQTCVDEIGSDRKELAASQKANKGEIVIDGTEEQAMSASANDGLKEVNGVNAMDDVDGMGARVVVSETLSGANDMSGMTGLERDGSKEVNSELIIEKSVEMTEEMADFDFLNDLIVDDVSGMQLSDDSELDDIDVDFDF